MEDLRAQEILSRVKEAVEKAKQNMEVHPSLIISIADQSGILVGEETLKQYLKTALGLTYNRISSQYFSTTVEITIFPSLSFSLTLINDPIWVAGRYLKHSRHISNTPMVHNSVAGYRKNPVGYRKRGRGKGRKKEETQKTVISISDTITNDSKDFSLQPIEDAQTPQASQRLPAVSDWLEPLRAYFDSEKVIFMSSGREDVDVRMLGNGRPFLAKLVAPKKNLPKQMDKIAVVTTEGSKEKKECTRDYDDINIPIAFPDSSVQLLHTALVRGKESGQLLKNAEEKKKKEYSVNIQAQEKKDKIISHLIDNGWVHIKDNVYAHPQIDILQRTPIRVSHRRSNLERKRSVYNCQMEISEEKPTQSDPNASNTTNMLLTLTADAGTYIKEFINSDFGRTNPSLSSMLQTYCHVVSLDVTGIDMPYPTEEITLSNITLIQNSVEG